MPEPNFPENLQVPVPLKGILGGSIEPTIIIDPAGPPTTVIPEKTNFVVRVEWNLTSPLLVLLQLIQNPLNVFTVRVAFESIGATPEHDHTFVGAPVSTNQPIVGGPLFQIPMVDNVAVPNAANTLPVGAYLMTAFLTFTHAGVPVAVAGISDERLVEIFPK